MNSQLHSFSLIAAPHTPVDENGNLKLAIVPLQVALLQRTKVRGAFICGTTGEGCSFTLNERQAIAEAWRAACPSNIRLIVHVGSLCLQDSLKLAAHAANIGADAIASIAPSFFKPAPPELVSWCSAIAGQATDLPFYYYHMPSMTGLRVSAEEFLLSADGAIPNLAGLKFTHDDLKDYRAATAVAGGKYEVLFGRDELLLTGWQAGARSAVGSTYNFAAPLYARLTSALANKDLESAKRCQKQASEFINVLHRHGGIAAGKAIMGLLGVDCGPVRPPLRRLAASDIKSLHDELQSIGFFDYISV